MIRILLIISLAFGCCDNLRSQFFRTYDVNQAGDFGRILFELDTSMWFLSRTSCLDNISCGYIGYHDKKTGDIRYGELVETTDLIYRPNDSHCAVLSDDTVYIVMHSGGDSSIIALISWDVTQREVLKTYPIYQEGKTFNFGMIQTSDSLLMMLNQNEDKDGNTTSQVLKINLEGEVIWIQELDSIRINKLYEISATIDTGFVVAYETAVGGLPGFSQRVAKFDKNGKFMFDVDLSLTIIFYRMVVTTNTDGNIIVSGEYVHPRDINDRRKIISVLNNDGEILDQFFLPESGSEITDILELTDGNYLFSGFSRFVDDNSAFQVGWVMKYSLTDGVLWERLFNEVDIIDQGSIFYNSLELDDGSLMLIGRNFAEVPNTDPPQRNQNTLIVKLDSMGCLQPDCGEVQVITALDNLASPAPSYDALFYPNPTTGEIFIQNFYDWKGARYIIYDLQGAQMSHGIIDTETIQLQADLPDGLYIIQLMGEDKRYAERVVLQR